MIRTLALAAALFFSLLGSAYAVADVDVNKADQAQLETIKGVGPATSKLILDERKKAAFKDWADFQSRIKGIGDKKAAGLSDAGLTVNGQKKSADAAPAKTAQAKPAREGGKEAGKAVVK